MALSFMDQHIIDNAARLTDISPDDAGRILDLYADMLGEAAGPHLDIVRDHPQACLTGMLQARITALLDIIERQREDLACQSSQIMDLADQLGEAKAELAGHLHRDMP